jgi:uncharacterized protein involved in type VI secretion and phage assembly
MKGLETLWRPLQGDLSLALATVIDTDDQSFLGRVKVTFDLMQGASGGGAEGGAGTGAGAGGGAVQAGIWLPVVTPFAGDGIGLFLAPEMNTSALVAFSNSDPRNAYVIGFLWNGKNKPPVQSSTEQANLYTIKTKAGRLISIDDSDSGGVSIKDKAGNVIAIKTNDKNPQQSDVEITSAGSLTIKANSISIESQGSMTIQTKQDLKLSSEAGNILLNS